MVMLMFLLSLDSRGLLMMGSLGGEVREWNPIRWEDSLRAQVEEDADRGGCWDEGWGWAEVGRRVVDRSPVLNVLFHRDNPRSERVFWKIGRDIKQGP